MATSGSFNTTAINIQSSVGDRYLQFAWEVKSQDITNNKTTISWTLKGAGGNSGYYYMAGNFKLVINGDTVYSSTNRIELHRGTLVASGTKTITHGSDGTKKFKASAEAGIYNVAVNSTGSETFTLPNIPRYATVKQTLKSKTETSITIDWSSDSTIDTIKYSTDNGSTWTEKNVTDGKSGSYTISGLKANTSYKIKTRVRRKDSQLTTDSSALSVTTYDYPYCTESPNFVLGNALTLKFYNPLSRAFKFYIIGNGKEIDVEYNCSGETYTGVNSTTTSVPYLYATIPNAKSGKYKVKVVYGTSEKIRDNGNTYSIVEKDCYPTFTTFTYKDTNETVSKIIGNDQLLVKGKSNLEVYITTANKMVAKNSATAKRYNVSIDTKSVNKDYSTSDLTIPVGVVSPTITNSEYTVTRLNVRAYDSRELSTPAYKDVTVLDYKEPVINASVKRQNNFEANSTLSVSGTYSRLTIDNVNKNTITAIEYRYRETGEEWSKWLPLTTTLSSGEFTCNDVSVTLDNQKSFEFEIKATDKLSSPTKTVIVDVGQAVFFISSNERKCYVNGDEVLTVGSAYPVGSVYCNSTNTNPADILGGTWELIDKEFKSTAYSDDGTKGAFAHDTTNISGYQVYNIYGGHTIRLRLGFTPKIAFTDDSAVNIGNFDFSKIGVSGFYHSIISVPAMSDAGNGLVMTTISNAGEITVNDVVKSTVANQMLYVNEEVTCKYDNMLDEFCDKFYWKRTG